MQDGRCHVEDGGAGDKCVAGDAGAGGSEDALRAVPDGDAGGDHRYADRSACIAVKAVVGAKYDGAVGAGVRE